MTIGRIRVLCVDDHRLVLDGIALIIGRQPDLEVAGLATSAPEAVDQFARCRPDVTLMDLQMGASSGLDAIRSIRRLDHDARIIVLTMYQGHEDVYRALNAGAVTYLLKDMLADELVRIIRQVHAGERPISPDVEARLAERATNSALTPRELQVITLMSKGMRNKEIAGDFGISEETVEVHVRNIFSKLKVHDRTAAVTEAVKRGIIHLS
jgi:DNA-binding NarL/FixJ family response regulator